MAKTTWTWLAVATLVGLGAAVGACSDDKEQGTGNPDSGTTADKPGFGDDKRRPTGTPFTLPTGIELAGTIVGADDEGNCPGQQVDPGGSGFMVRVCVPLRNTTNSSIEVRFTEMLVVLATRDPLQHGALLERVFITIPPSGAGPGGIDAGTTDAGAGGGVVHVPLHLYCLNKNRSPSDPSGRYEFGPISDSAQLRELYDLLKDKDIAGDGEKVEIVQEALYSITEGKGLTEDDKEAIGDL